MSPKLWLGKFVFLRKNNDIILNSHQHGIMCSLIDPTRPGDVRMAIAGKVHGNAPGFMVTARLGCLRMVSEGRVLISQKCSQVPGCWTLEHGLCKCSQGLGHSPN